jgi:hypothetical protein
MFLVERLTSRSSVALSVSIGYARAGGGSRAGKRSRSPDVDAPEQSAARHPVSPISRFFRSFPPHSAAKTVKAGHEEESIHG